jgi:hypothetical protein
MTSIRVTINPQERPAMLRVTAKADELHASERYCTCCGKPLAGKVAWLELDQRINKWHDLGGVPADKSQGWFAFGVTCAKRLKTEALSGSNPNG